MKLRTISLILLVTGGVLFAYLIGPRPRVGEYLRTVRLPEDLNAYLAASESNHKGIYPGTEKTIVWARPSRARTPWSIVYIHGYSATRQETYPLCERLASRLGANIFYTRLTGHGQSGAELAKATVNDLLNDTLEAVEIGKRLGERVIVIGTSCGGTLAAWLAGRPGNDDVMAYVLISPAFGFSNPASGLLTGPWGRELAQFCYGGEFVRVAANLKEAEFWTTRYPPEGLVTPVLLAEHVRKSALEKARRPVLVIYSPQDRLLSREATGQAFARLGSAVKKLAPLENSQNPESHVLAGDILAPEDTGRVADIIMDFISGLAIETTEDAMSEGVANPPR